MERIDDLSLLMTLEMGKPLEGSRAEIAYAAEFFRWFSEEAVRVDGRYTTEPNGNGRLLVMRQPVGPLLVGSRRGTFRWRWPPCNLGPAIAAGCTTVVKPADLTPLSTLALTQILSEAGLPPGVLNVVTPRPPAPRRGRSSPILVCASSPSPVRLRSASS